MRYLSTMVLVTAFSSSLVHAIPCEVGSLQSYIERGSEGCTIEDKTFFDFLDFGVLGGAAPILATEVTVTPLEAPGSPGLLLDFGVTAGSADLLQSLFGFSVMVLPGGMPIAKVSASISGSEVLSDGANTALFCLGTSDPACPVLDPILLFDVGFDSLLSDSRVFPPIVALHLIGDVVVDGGQLGEASLSSATLRFHETSVPEPRLWLPVGAGILTLGLIRGRARKAGKEIAT